MSEYKNKKIKTEKNSHLSLITSSFDDVPSEIVLDILTRLPVKSVAKFLLVSKFWAETIRSPHFIRSFQVRSSLQQDRLLVVFTYFDSKKNSQESYLFTVSSSSATTSYLSRITCPFYTSVKSSHYVNGLISLGSGLDNCIANPSTVPCKFLRGAKTSIASERSFLGYDPVKDEYKVLVCLGKRKSPSLGRSSYSHHQVVTLGAKNEEWRRIDYKTRHHHPMFNSVCIDGVLYYLASIGSHFSKLSLMRFNLESEKLDLFTSLPPEVRADSPYGLTLISYKKKVALATKISNYDHEVWVLDQHGWVKKSFSIKNKGLYDLCVRGSTLTGEFILAPQRYSDMFCIIHYNPDTNCYRRTSLKVQEDYAFKHRGAMVIEAMVFPDYVDCVRFL